MEEELFECPICHLKYAEKKYAEQCEAWCREHNSCNIEILKHAQQENPLHTQTVYLAGGCFWCTEAVFQSLKGVQSVTPGYSGGQTPNPTYNKVVEGNTGHAETIKIEFDPSIIPFEIILTVFFTTHDPTSLNKQGADVGDQYRSAIFYVDELQKRTAEEFIKKLEADGTYAKPIVTQLEPFTSFFEAEEYHRDYYLNNQDAPYCRINIDPKISKLKQKFAAYINPDALGA